MEEATRPDHHPARPGRKPRWNAQGLTRSQYAILKVIWIAPYTGRHIQQKTGLTHGTLMKGLRALRDMGRIYIDRYEPSGTKPSPVWKRGKGVDARPPPAATSTQRTQVWRERNPDWEDRQQRKKAGMWASLMKD